MTAWRSSSCSSTGSASATCSRRSSTSCSSAGRWPSRCARRSSASGPSWPRRGGPTAADCSPRLNCRRMFVFKAAVVGAGTMGGEIAQVIANSDIPVVLKDVDQKFVDQGLEKARSLWQGRVDQNKMETQELERKLGLITGTTSYEEFGDVD